MRRLALLAGLLGLSGCTLFEDLPDRSCKTSSDCFQAQGEVCDTTTDQCVAGPDAGATHVGEAISTPAPVPQMEVAP